MKIDRLWHCVNCGKKLYQTVVDSEGKIEKEKLPDFGEWEYLLSDGTYMRVCMCEGCKKTDIDTKEVMQTVRNGWYEGIEKNNWSKERKDSYKEKYDKIEIVGNGDNED